LATFYSSGLPPDNRLIFAAMETVIKAKPESENKLICAHCGLPAFEHIEENGKYFCCNGCKTAFSFFGTNETCTIPEETEKPSTQKLDYLDNPEIVKKMDHWPKGQLRSGSASTSSDSLRLLRADSGKALFKKTWHPD
jgi:hypothetical protein